MRHSAFSPVPDEIPGVHGSTRKRFDAFIARLDPTALGASRYGIERECLRVNADGSLALTPHPQALGSALTHPRITTDFSEALLEFVTPPCPSTWEVVQNLCDLHNYTHRSIGDEGLWPLSMPCVVQRAGEIPLARYGSSNVGTMKTVYRRGLGYRYGRTMQTIAGVHFNFSLHDDVWRALREERRSDCDLQDFKSAAYFGLVRNFRRLSWLLLYLFGASPAVCRSFLADRPHALQPFDDDTFYLPYATSLRMSGLGYSSDAQASLNISLNSLDEYTAGLARAIATPYPPYQEIGVLVDGTWRQLSDSLLQIENEYYSVVRPKRTARSGEKPTTALRERGVEYVEIRALDISPFDPVGVNQAQIRFIECLLVHCALTDSPAFSAIEQVSVDANQAAVASRGREPGLKLQRPEGEIELGEWALLVCDELQGIAHSLDSAHGGDHYQVALNHFAESVRDADRTPSAMLLGDMRRKGLSHAAYGVELTRRHKDYYRELEPLAHGKLERFQQEAEDSLRRQADVEAADDVDFATYLARYFAQR